MSSDELKRIEAAIFNAEMGLDKFGKNSPQGKGFLRELETLEKKKAELLKQAEQGNNEQSQE